MKRTRQPTDWEKIMGETLKGLREGRGLTQVQLAERSGVPLGSLRNYEQGHRTPLLDQAARLAKALGCSIDEIAPDVEIPVPKKGK
jgi:transcriptional regulator with XRE-family HTH domain